VYATSAALVALFFSALYIALPSMTVALAHEASNDLPARLIAFF
jgi:hypothetical protein